MKRSFFALAALAITSTAAAQAPAMTTQGIMYGFGVFGGVSIPTGDLSNGAGTGFHIGGLVDITEASWPVGFRIDAAYHGFGGKDITLSGTTFSEKAKIVPVTANVMWMVPMDATSSFRPYIIGGVGYYHLSDDVSCSGDCSEIGNADNTSANKFGLNIGGGANFNVGGVGAFVEARFHNLFTDGSSSRFIPISVGFTFHP